MTSPDSLNGAGSVTIHDVSPGPSPEPGVDPIKNTWGMGEPAEYTTFLIAGIIVSFIAVIGQYFRMKKNRWKDD